jgi:hypothetical protein
MVAKYVSFLRERKKKTKKLIKPRKLKKKLTEKTNKKTD